MTIYLVCGYDWEDCQHVVAYSTESAAVREVERLNGLVANQDLPQFVYDYEAIEVRDDLRPLQPST